MTGLEQSPLVDTATRLIFILKLEAATGAAPPLIDQPTIKKNKNKFFIFSTCYFNFPVIVNVPVPAPLELPQDEIEAAAPKTTTNPKTNKMDFFIRFLLVPSFRNGALKYLLFNLMLEVNFLVCHTKTQPTEN